MFVPKVNHMREKLGLTDSWVCLYVDGHTGHEDAELVKFCMENHIDIVEIVPHASHLMQPLDLTFFRAFRAALMRVAQHFLCHITLFRSS